MKFPISETTELQEIELIPVIELEPNEFANSNREAPTGTIKVLTSEWAQYWKASLNDAGIRGVKSISPDAWHVATNEISVQKLGEILRVLLDDSNGLDYLNDPDLTPVLSGGYALKSEAEGFAIKPMCCSDLSGLKDWKEAAEVRNESWQQLWIGHPWVSVKRLDADLVISALHESTEPIPRWQLNPEELKIAIEKAEVELKRFSTDIASVLKNWGMQNNAEQIASRLIGE